MRLAGWAVLWRLVPFAAVTVAVAAVAAVASGRLSRLALALGTVWTVGILVWALKLDRAAGLAAKQILLVTIAAAANRAKA